MGTYAWGLLWDRGIVMIRAGADSLREVIPFPNKPQSAVDLNGGWRRDAGTGNSN